MALIALFGWNSQDWVDTIGLVVIFFVAFPLLVTGLIVMAVGQGLGERAENQRRAGRWGRQKRADTE